MSSNSTEIPEFPELHEPEDATHADSFHFGLARRGFVQVLGAGLLIAVGPRTAHSQNRRGGRSDGRSLPVGARIHISEDGTATVLTGKVECGQGARAEITQAAVEELGFAPEKVRVLMADTDAVPDDGLTAGSRTTPSTVPAVRQAAAAARRTLLASAAARWNVPENSVEMRRGAVIHPPSERSVSAGELARDPATAEAFRDAPGESVSLIAVKDWKTLGTSVPRPNQADIVTGSHLYPSDQSRPGMLHGKILRPPSFGARLVALDLAPAQALPDVVVVRDGDFAGVAAPSTFRAEHALELLADHAKWEPAPHPSSREIYDRFRETAQGGIPSNPFGAERDGAKDSLRASYRVAYVQHAPMETRVALAEWQEGRLTVWTGTQNPFGNRGELARAFKIPEDRIRVIVPDFGGGFGGKHTGEVAVEAARLAQAARRPVRLRWTRSEEFTWAYFRPAALIEVEASLDAQGAITSWHFINVNSGNSAVETPYRTGKSNCKFVSAAPPLRHGSYRALASTANTFARESFMDELALRAKANPLEFRLAHLENARLRAVLEEAARGFEWRRRREAARPAGTGIGLACGTEKGSYTAACAEIVLNGDGTDFTVRRLAVAFECGAIVNPDNLVAQVHGAVIQGLGPALREEMQFSDGRMRNAAFSRYLVPRFRDVPELEVRLLNRTDLPSVGAGETPVIGVAPAIANAVFDATQKRIRQMPIRLSAAEGAA